MADDEQNEDLKGYYTINFEKFIELMNEVDHKYMIAADIVKKQIIETSTDQWENTAIRDLMRIIVQVGDLRDFLEMKVENPSEQEVKLSKKYDIKDVLMTTEDLARLNMNLLSIEEDEADLEICHKISLQTH